MSFPYSVPRAGYVLVVSIVLAACSGDSSAQSSTTAAVQAQTVPTVPVTPATASSLPNFVPLVEKSGPAVVNVEVLQQQRDTGRFGGVSPDDPFYDFFRRFGIPVPDPGQGQGPRGNAPPLRGAGSGFIVTADGYILTNAHVVSEADEVTVKLTDRREYQAKVVGVDKGTDVAVIKIEAKNLPVVRIGDPSQLKPGEWVLAIGSPFGFENSATAGIVSATSRSLPEGPTNYVPFIQTDVAVNPGNSGGPLFNMRGEVVGINSQIFSRTGGYMGLSFAIPIDVAMDVREQLVKTGRVTRSRIGVTIQNVNAQFAESFGLDRPHGALISSVSKDSPGEKAGLKPGDVILAVNGRSIETSSELPTIVARMKPGTAIDLTVWRGGKEQKISLRTDELKDDNEQVPTSVGAPGQPGSDEASRLGISVRQLTPQEKQRVKTEGTLVVQEVDGPAASAGVQPGDIIIGVNGKRVKTVSELQEAAKTSGKTVALLVQRDDAQIFIPLRPN